MKRFGTPQTCFLRQKSHWRSRKHTKQEELAKHQLDRCPRTLTNAVSSTPGDSDVYRCRNKARSASRQLLSGRSIPTCLEGSDGFRPDVMAKMEKKALSAPDERRSFDKGQLELVTLGGVTFGRATLQPGWKWSTCVKPIVSTQSSEAVRLQYHVSGRLRVRMDDGSEDEFGPGEVSLLPPGHDAWVVGDEPVVVIDILGMANLGPAGTEEYSKLEIRRSTEGSVTNCG